MSMQDKDRAAIEAFLAGSSLGDVRVISAERLSGGVSSDIWKVALTDRTVVVKRALPALRVAQVWEAPLSRNVNEANWLEVVAGIAPAAVPRVVHRDAEAAMFAMEHLDHPVWKSLLKAGAINPDFAAKVGDTVGLIHARTAGQPEIAERFDTGDTFNALRVEPYLLATARAHPDLADRLEPLAAATLGTNRVLVHGDVSPKNILVAQGPIILDAECAWYGEPAFDLAFCLNHLLLKCLVVPSGTAALLTAFDRMTAAYLACVDWEPAAEVERRTARLLPALLLARIDGKSPVEYIDTEPERDRVRRIARPLIQTPPETLAAVRTAFHEGLDHV
ncbi:aminoglycoside phosphotransferase [Oceanicola sp. 22II-s10i]|nr:aminoglycoside phosphotransferase [Oceanicola sp. 22II-s10i]